MVTFLEFLSVIIILTVKCTVHMHHELISKLALYHLHFMTRVPKESLYKVGMFQSCFDSRTSYFNIYSFHHFFFLSTSSIHISNVFKIFVYNLGDFIVSNFICFNCAWIFRILCRQWTGTNCNGRHYAGGEYGTNATSYSGTA